MAAYMISSAMSRMLQDPKYRPNVKNYGEFQKFKQMIGKESGGRYTAVSEDEMEGKGIQPGAFGKWGYSIMETDLGKGMREREQQMEANLRREEQFARQNRKISR